MTFTAFDREAYPHTPKILFIGIPYSAHALSWIGMLPPLEFSVRFFGVTDGYPDADWPYKTYIISPDLPFGLNPATRQTLYPQPEAWQAYHAGLERLPEEQRSKLPVPTQRADTPVDWLAQVIMDWEPDVIHTLGLDPAAFFYLQARDQYPIAHIGAWVVQSRGRLDLLFHDTQPEMAGKIERVLAECDQFVADNPISYQLAETYGLDPAKKSALGMIPGSGGVDVSALKESWHQLPSQRPRTIIWPKAADNIAARVLPIFEALKACWAQIQPCELLIFPGFNGDLDFWFKSLPQEIQKSCHVSGSVSRREILSLMTQSRVMLAPSLTDGVPNVLYEAMAAGAFPIVSPLETLLPLFEPEQNVLYARNLYPSEIAAALVRAMNDDALVDGAARRNLDVVKRLADWPANAARVCAYYQDLAASQRVLTLSQKESNVQQRLMALEKQAADLAEKEKQYQYTIVELEQREAGLQQIISEQRQQITTLTERNEGLLRKAAKKVLVKLHSWL